MAADNKSLAKINACGVGDQSKKSSELGTGVLGQKRPTMIVATGGKGGKKMSGGMK